MYARKLYRRLSCDYKHRALAQAAGDADLNCKRQKPEAKPSHSRLGYENTWMTDSKQNF